VKSSLLCGACTRSIGDATVSPAGISIKTRERLPDWLSSEFLYNRGLTVTCPYCSTDLDPASSGLVAAAGKERRIVLNPY
jgi:hypothetical protein